MTKTMTRTVSDITGKTVVVDETMIEGQTLEDYFAEAGLAVPSGGQSVVGSSGTRYAPTAGVPMEDTLVVIEQIRNG